MLRGIIQRKQITVSKVAEGLAKEQWGREEGNQGQIIRLSTVRKSITRNSIVKRTITRETTEEGPTGEEIEVPGSEYNSG